MMKYTCPIPLTAGNSPLEANVWTSTDLTGLSPSTTYSFVLQAQYTIVAPKWVSAKTLTFTTPPN